MRALARSYRDLEVYKAAFVLQQEIFQASKEWPREERYALTDQVRRSSRSIGANVAEAWAKRRYPAHFLSKLTDADGELQETFHWLDAAIACDYLREPESGALVTSAESVGKMLGSMIQQHESFCSPHAHAQSPTQ
jgi:four helix bundle protein